MFRGINSINLDSKGRIAIPARYRNSIIESVDSHMIITNDPYEKCLGIYPINVWEKIEANIQKLPNSNEMNRRLKRILLSPASEVDMDASGRLLIPNVLRERAGLEKSLMLVSEGDMFRLWDQDTWNAKLEEDHQVMTSETLDPNQLPEFNY